MAGNGNAVGPGSSGGAEGKGLGGQGVAAGGTEGHIPQWSCQPRLPLSDHCSLCPAAKTRGEGWRGQIALPAANSLSFLLNSGT